jgi:hypothetical protein
MGSGKRRCKCDRGLIRARRAVVLCAAALSSNKSILYRPRVPIRRQLRTSASPPSVLSTAYSAAPYCKQRQCEHYQLQRASTVHDPDSRSGRERCPTHFFESIP